MKQKLVFVLMFCTLMACDPNQSKRNSIVSSNDAAIIGGTVVKAKDPISKRVVGVYNTYFKSICTGTVVAGNFVLTAAHCAHTNTESLQIVFGVKIDKDEMTEEIELPKSSVRSVLDIYIHPNYNHDRPNKTDHADIALIKFSGTLPSGYKSVSLLENSEILKPDAPVIMAGYGVSKIDLTPIDGSKIPKIFEEIFEGRIICKDMTLKECQSVKMENAGRLRRTVSAISSVSKTEITLKSSSDAGVCYGDSGGPAFIKSGDEYYLFGVTSRSDKLCRIAYVYTNVVYYLDWIKDYIKLNPPIN